MTASFTTASELALTLTLALALVPSVAHADPPPPPGPAREAIAEALFRKGQELIEAGKVDEACETLAESHRIEPALGTLLNLAVCHDKQGRTATAWAELASAAARASQTGQRDRERFAQERMRALEPRLSRVRIDVPDGEHPSVTLDGEAVTVWTTPLPLDPGTHSITVSAPRKRSRTLTVVVPSGPSLLAVRIEALEPEPLPAVRDSPSNDQASTTVSTKAAGRTPPARIAGYGALALGGIALGLGAAFGVHTIALKQDVDAHCNGSVCDSDGLSAERDAHAAATTATVALIVGAALVVTGGVLVLVTPARDGATMVAAAQW